MEKSRKIPEKVLIDFLMIVLASFFSILYNRQILYVDEMNQVLAGVYYIFKYIPIVLVTALGGAVPGMISVLVLFIYKSIAYSSFSYLCFIYLLVCCVTDILARRKFFSNIPKTLLTSVFLQFLTGNFWGIILFLLAGKSLTDFSGITHIYIFLNEAPGCFIGCLIVYAFFRFLPAEKKLKLGNGKYYVDASILDEDERYEVEGKSKIGAVVMNIIVFEAIVLGLSAELASNTLIPTMKVRSIDDTMDSYIDERWHDISNTEMLESLVSITMMNDVVTSTEELETNGYQLGSTAFGVKLSMLILIIVIPLAVFVNRYAQRRIARPIRSLSKAVTGIYNSNDIDINANVKEVHNLHINTGDEIEELYHAIDLTIYRLMEYIELVKTRQSIEDQLNIEKSANEAKSRFLSNISHEIRTPINAVLGFDEMILRESNDSTVIRYAKDIQSSGKTLLALINDVLDFSKIEAGKLEIIPVEYELRSLINDVVNMARVRAVEKNLELLVNVEEEIPHVLYGDEVRIKQCVINIVTNAIKYTEAGSVTIDISYENVEAESPEDAFEENKILLGVKVTDTGIGIKEEDIDKLSGAFERIDEKRNRTIEGSGLGINIVNSLLSMMDSKLVVKSEYGKGSEFSFAIVQRVVDMDPIGDFSEAYKEAVKDTHDYHETFHAPDAKILVVDDTKTNLTVVEGLLKKTQIMVDTATSGMEALDLVSKNKYDIIFLDHRMPEMDGIQTFHAMEELSGNLNKKTPVIALTANAVSGSREMYFKEGFTNYMSKPVDPVKLEDMIMSYLPSFKVTRPGDKDFVSNEEEEKETDKEAMQEILKVSGIDIETAIARCGSPDVALEVMKDFKLAIDERSGLIERYEAEGNIKNYTIYVHGLKSSARAIGAIDLADKAEYLEQCGNDENVDAIKKLTPDLLELYRSYNQKLSLLTKEEDKDKPEIAAEQLESAYESIKEFVSASYFDSADDIMKMLEEYRIPQAYASKHNEIKRLMGAVDRDGLLNIL
ncbi:Signal transduction histidine kinase [Butyrivibrio proteoclasticus]|uniref:Circadian input-output histidine kinase CikA n=1 Tax=Butyrivibrio proteoclasticus TaxID=43305 RepID=A0A1I5T9C6_9FIRM|nr:response regulator [Butyrivibrio proteoclasticus]SFP79649.1 Signal transduction histidine kinase [Butyrivibrio proteoclasticus]